MENKKKLLVTLADQNFVDQAKQLFSSAYWNAGWQGDYMLLSNQIDENDLLWFSRKGIIIKKCQTLHDGKLHNNIYPSAVLSKFYLFTNEFKKWDNIVFLDADIIVRASIDYLTHTQALLGVKSTSILKKYFYSFEKSEEYKFLTKEYDLHFPAFNTGVMAYNSKIIKEKTFDDLISIFNKYKNICTSDDPILNLYFSKQWFEIPIVYNVGNIYLSVFKKNIGIVLHFATPFYEKKKECKPWKKNNPYYYEWSKNLELSEKIDLKKIPSPKTWSPLKKKYYTSLIKIFFFLLLVKNKFKLLISSFFKLPLLDMIIGQIGLFIKKRNYNLYIKLRKILKIENELDKDRTPIGLNNLKADINDNLNKKNKTEKQNVFTPK